MLAPILLQMLVPTCVGNNKFASTNVGTIKYVSTSKCAGTHITTNAGTNTCASTNVGTNKYVNIKKCVGTNKFASTKVGTESYVVKKCVITKIAKILQKFSFG